MTISFPRTGPVFTTRGTVAFYAYVDDEKVLCEISAEVLSERFAAGGLSAVALIRTFEDNRQRIESTAAQVLTAKHDLRRPLLLAASNFETAVNAYPR